MTATTPLATETTTLTDPTTPDTRGRGCAAFNRGHASPGGDRGRLADRRREVDSGAPPTCGMRGGGGYTADGAC